MICNSCHQVQVNWCRHGFLFHGANVAQTALYGCAVGFCDESGIKVLANGGSQIRWSPSDKKINPNVLRDWEENEIFQGQLNSYVTSSNLTFYSNGVLSVGGGSLGVSLHGCELDVNNVNAWLLDTNFGNFRVYSCRSEGDSGILRSTDYVGFSNFHSHLTDFVTTSFGGIEGLAIKQLSGIPLNIFGGTYCAPIGVPNTWWHSVSRMYDRAPIITGVQQSYGTPGTPSTKHCHFTGRVVDKAYGRGRMEVVMIQQPPQPGRFVMAR
jgi:hypothetical protein